MHAVKTENETEQGGIQNLGNTSSESPVQQTDQRFTAKQVADMERQAKAIRKQNMEAITDFRLEVEHGHLQAATIENSLRSMKAFIEAETIRPEYLKLLNAKKLRDNPLDISEAKQGQIITP